MKEDQSDQESLCNGQVDENIEYASLFGLTNEFDVVVANAGFHVNFNATLKSRRTFKETLPSLVSMYTNDDPRRFSNRSVSTRLPFLIFRETSPQHFTSVDGTYDPHAPSAKLGICRNTTSANSYNAQSNKALKEAGITVLKIWSPSRSIGSQH